VNTNIGSTREAEGFDSEYNL